MTADSIFLQSPEFISGSVVEIEYSPNQNSHNKYCDNKLFFVQEGQGKINIDNNEFVISEGDLILFNPMAAHSEISFPAQPLRGIYIFFKDLYIANSSKGDLVNSDKSPVFHLQGIYVTVNNLLVEIIREYDKHEYGYIEICSSLLKSVIILILRDMAIPKRQAISPVALEIKRYIERNYKKDLSLTELSNIVFVSPYYLGHIFKQEIGVSPIQYLINCRINEAKNLLTSTNLSITDIAAIVGYSNPNYFNILFKKMTGRNPGKFKKDFFKKGTDLMY